MCVCHCDHGYIVIRKKTVVQREISRPRAQSFSQICSDGVLVVDLIKINTNMELEAWLRGLQELYQFTGICGVETV